MTMTLSATDRTEVKAAIDRAQRAAIEAKGGYGHVEHAASHAERALQRRIDALTEDGDHQRALETAWAKVARLEARVEQLTQERDQLAVLIKQHKVHVRGTWWHAEARRLREQGMSYPAIGRHFGVDHTTVMYACKKSAA